MEGSEPLHQRISVLMLRCVRTTLTLDDDVAAHLDRLRKLAGRPYRELVNDALRAGLVALEKPATRQAGPYTEAVDLGRPRLPDLDDVSEALAILEGDGHR
jgi:predicted transcriptional regulator